MQELFRSAYELVKQWQRPLLLTHARPDGDAVGGLKALRTFLREEGANPLPCLYGECPMRYSFLWRKDRPAESEEPLKEIARFKPDGVIIVDTGAYQQIEPVADWLRDCGLPRIVIDHHICRDMEADILLTDETASAAALIVQEWGECMGWTIDSETADALWVGLATDTGWFRFSNTDARTMEAAGRLVARGANPADLFDRIFNREKVSTLRLRGAVLDTLELHHRNRVATMCAVQEHFDRTGANSSDTADAVQLPMIVGSVIVSILFVEDGDVIRCNFRSKPPGEGVPEINVADLASQFGGGGHARAAGARITGTLEDVRSAVMEALLENWPNEA